MRNALLAGVIALLAGCGSGGFAGDAGAPAATNAPAAEQATPEETVSQFLDAVAAQNWEEGRRLVTPEHAERMSQTADGWFENVVSLSNVEVGTARPDDVESKPGFDEAVNVPVTFDLEQREEMSMENGPTAWGYILVRKDGGPWLIADQGMG